MKGFFFFFLYKQTQKFAGEPKYAIYSLKIYFQGWESMFPVLKLMFLAWKHRLIGYKKTFL